MPLALVTRPPRAQYKKKTETLSRVWLKKTQKTSLTRGGGVEESNLGPGSHPDGSGSPARGLNREAGSGEGGLGQHSGLHRSVFDGWGCFARVTLRSRQRGLCFSGSQASRRSMTIHQQERTGRSLSVGRDGNVCPGKGFLHGNLQGLEFYPTIALDSRAPQTMRE